MQQRPITDPGEESCRFTLDGPAVDETCQLRFEGRPIGTVKGIELVGFFRVDDLGWLIITDCDSPFEETVYLHLLGTDLRPRETTTLGGMYVPGIVDQVERLSPRRFALSFPTHQQRHEIRVEPETTGLFGRNIRWLHVTPAIK